MGRTLQLYQLQLLDTEIDKTNQQLAEIIRQLGESEALRKARALVSAAEQHLRKVQAAMQDLELEVKSLAEKIGTQENKLYSGKVLNAKEAANLQDEVASLKRRHGEREERLLEAMVAVEEAESTLHQRQTNLAELEATWAADQKDLIETRDTLEARRSDLINRRPAMAIAVAQENLPEYEQLRAKKAGRAMALVRDRVCQGCGMTLSSSRVQKARAGEELIYCSTCGRILYVP